MTVAADLNTLVGTAFGTTPKADTVTLAKKYFGIADGDGDNQELATAMLAHAILLNRRQAEKGRTDNTIAVLNIDELVTPEMERLLNKDKKSTSYNIINYKPLSGNQHWCQ